MQHRKTPTETCERAIIEGIAKKRLIVATYNGAEMTLAPHQLFRRHGALFLGALNTQRTWRADEDPRLGQFKLDGLSGLTVVDESFEPLAHFANAPAREGDEPLFAVALQ